MSEQSSTQDGPRIDDYHNRELPGRSWETCRGCPSFRVFDWHYFYCRRLGDQSHPDAWNAGWKRLGDTVWNEERKPPCGLPVLGAGKWQRVGEAPEVREHLERGA